MQIFCIEQNYLAKRSEQKIETAIASSIYTKPAAALLPKNNSFIYPAFAKELYCSCELVLQISKDGKNIAEKSAGEFYDSITTGINFIAFDNKENELPKEVFWQKTKAWHNSSIIGKWLSSKNFSNINNIDFCLYKNREMVQFCNSGLMIHDFNALISTISDSHNLYIGDLIFTGTQVNIGELYIGDTLESFIEDDSLLEFEIQ